MQRIKVEARVVSVTVQWKVWGHMAYSTMGSGGDGLLVWGHVPRKTFCKTEAVFRGFSPFREGTFLIKGEGVGRGILEFFCKESRGPPTSQVRLMHDPSQIPKQKHLTLTLPPPPPRQK